ncbi:MAG: META domain-containing protein, partial [Anaerolineales bacterium]|nr:META domain-containing protein [Anaerolineales bacterium]
SYFGVYQLDGSKLAIQPQGSTMMACPELVTAQAEAFTAGLGSTSTFTIEGQKLALKDANGKAILTFQASSQDLAGTTWNAIGVNNGKQAVVSLVLDTEVTAVFNDDGTVTGSAGCNTYNAPYELEGKQIKIGPVATTRKFCAQPEGVMEQETAYLAALEKATTYELVGTNLTLGDSQGATQVEYVRP